MSSEAITQNDLREILSRAVGSIPSEFKKLLWTNPSLSSGCSAFDLTFANAYDAYEIIFSMDNGGYLFLPSVLAVAGNSPCGADFTHSSGGRYYRSVTLNGATLSFTTGYYNGSANVNACVPYKIYGIKYERVAPPQLEVPQKIELLRVSSGLANTDYTLADNISNYDIISFVGLSSYGNRWGTMIPTSVFAESTNNYWFYLGSETTVYNIGLHYTNDTKITVAGHGTATTGLVITGMQL